MEVLMRRVESSSGGGGEESFWVFVIECVVIEWMGIWIEKMDV